MIARTNFAAAVVDGLLSRMQGRSMPVRCRRRSGRPEDLESVISFYCELILGAKPDSGWHDRLLESLGRADRGSPGSAGKAVGSSWPHRQPNWS